MADSAVSTYGVHSEVGTPAQGSGVRTRARPRPAHPRQLRRPAVRRRAVGAERPARPLRLHDKMRDRGVEVVELHDLLAETLAVPGPGTGCSTARSSPPPGRARACRRHPAFLDARPAPSSPSSSSAGWPPPTCPTTSAPGTVALARETDGRPRIPHAAAAQHPLHPRHDLLDLRRRHPQPAVLARPPRRDPADEGHLHLPPRLRRLDRLVGRSRSRTGAWPPSRVATSCPSATASS